MPLIGSGLIQSADTWPKSSDWLIRDEFTDTVSAGSVNGTAATPGPGTRAVTDTGNLLSVGSGAITLATGNSVNGDPSLRYGAIAREAGLSLIFRCTPLTGALFWEIGFDTDYLTSFPNYMKFHFRNDLTVKPMGNTFLVANWAANTEFDASIVLRETGALYFVGNTLAWVEETFSTTPVYPGVSNVFNANVAVGSLRVIQLPTPFDTDDGLATDVHSGSVAEGTTFEHGANALIEATITTVPSADSIDIVFRKQDASNYWICRVNSSGDISLQEVVAGTPTQRSVAAGVVSSGHRVVVIAEGSTIKGYSNNALRWTYSSATNFATATAGEVDALGDGGAVSDVKTWPRTLSGTAASILNKVSA